MKFEKIVPESVGISSRAILSTLRAIRKNSIELHGMMILRHGKVLLEGYMQPYRKEIPHTMFSFSKSLTSTAVAFLIQEGKLTLKDRLVDIFPEYMPDEISENLSKVDIFSLLTMSCGNEKEIDWDLQYRADWLKTFFANEFKYEPGTMFLYNTAGTNVLAAVVRKLTGQNVTEYLKPRLFDPLEMGPVSCIKLEDGTEMGGAGMRLTLRDMAAFIQFCLQRGAWDQKQLLFPEWFDLISKKQIDTVNELKTQSLPNWVRGYSFQFWQCVPENVYRADGAYGQFGIVMPEKDMVIVIQSATMDADLLLNLVWENLLPGIADIELPEDPVFANMIPYWFGDGASIPVPFGSRARGTEQAINDKLFVNEGLLSFERMVGGAGLWDIDDTPMRAIAFRFLENECILQIGEGQEIQQVHIGLDGRFTDSVIHGKTFAAAGRWETDKILQIDIRNVVSVSGSRLMFEFMEDGCILKRNYTMLGGPGLGEKAYAPVNFKMEK